MRLYTLFVILFLDYSFIAYIYSISQSSHEHHSSH